MLNEVRARRNRLDVELWIPKSPIRSEKGGWAKTYSALGNSAEILSTNESKRSRDGKDGSLETHL
jgi:hypothetical protein